MAAKFKQAKLGVEAPALKCSGLLPGRGSRGASQVESQRNPLIVWGGEGRLRVGAWNVRTLRKAGKLENLIREMDRKRLDVVGLSEVRWKECGDLMNENVRMIHSGCEGGKNGVAIVLSKRTRNSVIGIEIVNKD